jgi:hypothetical protein
VSNTFRYTNIGSVTVNLDILSKNEHHCLTKSELYKKTLAAELTCQPGDPSADQIVEDIFAGGDGWGSVRDGEQQQRAALRENKRS